MLIKWCWQIASDFSSGLAANSPSRSHPWNARLARTAPMTATDCVLGTFPYTPLGVPCWEASGRDNIPSSEHASRLIVVIA
jgi:hypothetical protein